MKRSVLPVLFLMAGCSGHPTAPTQPAPAWVHQPTRTVDAGYIVYVGTGEDASLERAVFKAESMAIADLANECSLAPKGARIEDRYDESSGYGRRAYAKIGIQFEECESAKKALRPEEIRNVANMALTQQLKQYQELYYTASTEPGTNTEDEDLGSLGDHAPTPTGTAVVVRDQTEYFIVRQRIVYWKQTVILAPQTVYVADSPETSRLVSRLSSATERVRAYSAANPQVHTAPVTWTSLQADPSVHLPGHVAHLKTAVTPPRPAENLRPAASAPRERPARPPKRYKKRKRW